MGYSRDNNIGDFEKVIRTLLSTKNVDSNERWYQKDVQ